MVITDAGCAGRFGSLVMDADLPISPAEPRQRCLYFHNGSCLECVQRCPVGALDSGQPIDKYRCYDHLLGVASKLQAIGLADVCGKCAIGPCSCESAV
jgi:epoxyqueuosine reductase QueG